MPSEIYQKLEHLVQDKFPSPQVSLLPGRHFIVKALDLPEEVEESELPGYAEMSVEGMSPFPVEQLSWGFLSHPDSAHLLLYAASTRSLKKTGGVSDFEGPYNMLPAFAAGVGLTFDDPTVLFVSTKDGISALFYKAGDPVPERIDSEVIEPLAELEDAEEDSEAEEEDEMAGFLQAQPGAEEETEPEAVPLTPEDILEARADLLEEMDSVGYRVEEGVRNILRADVDNTGKICFHSELIHEDGSTSELPPLVFPLEDKRLWFADVRSSEFKDSARKQRAYGTWAWRSMIAAGITLLVAFMAWLGVLVWDEVVQSRQELRANQEGRVASIQGNQALLTKLEQFEQEGVNIFGMLELVNTGRPASIHFEEADARSHAQIQLDGEARSSQDVNTYIDRLRALEDVSDVEVSMRSRQTTTFNAMVTFAGVPEEYEYAELREDQAPEEAEGAEGEGGQTGTDGEDDGGEEQAGAGDAQGGVPTPRNLPGPNRGPNSPNN